MTIARLHAAPVARSAVLTAALAVLLTCAGCGSSSSEEPDVALGGDATSSSSPSATASSAADAPTKPELPAAAGQKTKAGRLAFARYFVEAYAYGLGSNDPSAMMAVALPDGDLVCDSCTSYATYLERMEKKGQVRRPWQLPVRHLVDTGMGRPGLWVVDVLVDRPRLWDVDEAGTKHRVQAAEPNYLIEVGMTWSDDSWKATGWLEKKAT